MSKPRLLYFGPLKESGHYLFHETGEKVYSFERPAIVIPWLDEEIDGTLQPGCHQNRWGCWVHEGAQREGEAVVHHKSGWTALSFWDSTIDTRPGCSSTYIAEGEFTFEQMVELAKERFPQRWAAMKFEVVEMKSSTTGGGK